MSTEIVVVSGLPRSGTSLMMQMLDAGGLPLATDGVRPPDADNPRGYFEFESVKRLRAGSAGFLSDLGGRAVKIVSLLLRELPRGPGYRVIFMERELSEVLVSQRRMLARRGVADPGDDGEMLSALRAELARVDRWLAARDDVAVLKVVHAELLRHPAREAARVGAFLGGDLDTDAMAAAVDPALYRCRDAAPDQR